MAACETFVSCAVFNFKSETMIIKLASGVGTGPTKLGAFDAALNDAGVANYNIIRLSSVIPPKTKIVKSKKALKGLPGGWGDRLYVVMAEMRVDTPNQEAGAGIGWVQEQDSGKGLFVEHEGYSEDTVRSDIQQSLESLMATRNVDFGDINMVVKGEVCKHLPVCSLVVAVYQASDWQNNAEPI